MKITAVLLLLWILPMMGKHGYSVNQHLKYPADFSHYDFVNPAAPFGGNLKLGELGDFDHINPHVSNSMRSGRVHAFHIGTLTARSFDEPMSDYCACAESMTVAPDGKSVEFRIRKNVQWDKGYGSLTPQDVVFSFETWRKHGSIFTRSLYQCVQKVEVLDQVTVRFTFTSSSPTLPSIVGGMPLLCKAFYQKKGISALQTEPLLALGPYRIHQYRLGEYISYEYREGFWGKNIPVYKGLANYKTITVRYYRDAEVMRMALIKGDVDSVIERDPVYIARKKLQVDNGDVHYYTWNFQRPPVLHFIIMNVRKAYLRDRRVRQALYLLFRFDLLSRYQFQSVYEPIRSLFQGTPSEAKGTAHAKEKELLQPFLDILPNNVFTPFTHEHHHNGEGYRIRIQKAVKLLKEAGWHLDTKRHCLYNKETQHVFPHLHIYCNGWKEKLMANDFKLRLQAVGITLIVHQAEVPYLSHIMGSHKLYDFVFFRYAGTSYPGLGLGASFYSRMARRCGSRNYAGIAHPAVDWLLDYIQDSRSIDEQVMAARALDRVIMHEYYYIPLFCLTRATFWARDYIIFPKFTKAAGYILQSSYIRPQLQQ